DDEDEPAAVQAAACAALGLILPADRDETAAVLRKKLTHPDALVRARAALALFRVAEDKGGLKEAVAGLGSRSLAVRVTAAETVWRINKDANAVALLVRLLEEENLEGDTGEGGRRLLAEALGRIGSSAKDAVPELTKLIANRDYLLATAARAALKSVDPEAAKKSEKK
ncbi:MAG: hypothetical protein K2V38_18960, partial [Gemmataceae bacterium]|nr:hypothetical protein [Gemmataceae bacterium]